MSLFWSLILLLAETRKTYRAVFSEPTLKIPAQTMSEARAQDLNLENTLPAESMSTLTENDGVEIARTAHETIGMLTASRKRISQGQMEQSADKRSATHSRDESLIAKKKKRRA
jgi:hypothetical protein